MNALIFMAQVASMVGWAIDYRGDMHVVFLGVMCGAVLQKIFYETTEGSRP